MSTAALELLKLVGLLDTRDGVADLDVLSNEQLREQLNYYCEKRREGFDAEVERLRSQSEGIAGLISSRSGTNDITALMPHAIVYSRVIADDPLFRLVVPGDEQDRAFNSMMGMTTAGEVDRGRVKHRLAQIASLQPLIQEGMLSLLPVWDVHKPKGARPILFSEDGFRSSIPEHVYEYVQQHAMVRPGVPIEQGVAIFDTAVTEPVRVIEVAFPDDGPGFGGATYSLASTRFAGTTEDGKIIVEHFMDWETPPEEPFFDAWVKQSINQTAFRRLREMTRELRLADMANAVYVTESAFESQLCGLTGGPKPTSPDHMSAVNFLNANLPVLHALSPGAVAKLRTENASLFSRFQSTLLEVSSELNGLQSGFEQKAKQLFSKEIEPQIHEIGERWHKLVYSAAGAVGTAGATFGLALLSSPTLPLASTMALSSILGFTPLAGSVAEYLSGKKTPAYIWAKLVRG